MKKLFVTGVPRSGTTLLARLVAGEGAARFFQPLPLIFPYAMRAFLQAGGSPEDRIAYPITDDQFDDFIARERLEAFLGRWTLDAQAARALLENCRAFCGQTFRPDDPFASLQTWTSGGPIAFAEHYMTTHGASDAVPWVWKELVGENLAPSLHAAGWTVVLSIRDPRRVIASALLGRGADYVGAPRPLLFLARQWRRSALYALARPHGIVPVRNEDLIQDAAKALKDAGLGEPDVSALQVPPNTSFAQARAELPRQAARFIEAVCFFEMCALGYPTSVAEAELGEILDAGPGEEVLHRPALRRYLWTLDRRAEERDRIARIKSAAGVFTPEAFLFESAYSALCDANGRNAQS